MRSREVRVALITAVAGACGPSTAGRSADGPDTVHVAPSSRSSRSSQYPDQPRRVVDAHRVGGDTSIVLARDTEREIRLAGRTLVTASVRYCVGTDGAVSDVEVVGPSGFPAYDDTLAATVRTWRYRPLVVDGTPTPMCTRATLRYDLLRPRDGLH